MPLPASLVSTEDEYRVQRGWVRRCVTGENPPPNVKTYFGFFEAPDERVVDGISAIDYSQIDVLVDFADSFAIRNIRVPSQPLLRDGEPVFRKDGKSQIMVPQGYVYAACARYELDQATAVSHIQEKSRLETRLRLLRFNFRQLMHRFFPIGRYLSNTKVLDCTREMMSNLDEAVFEPVYEQFDARLNKALKDGDFASLSPFEPKQSYLPRRAAAMTRMFDPTELVYRCRKSDAE